MTQHSTRFHVKQSTCLWRTDALTVLSNDPMTRRIAPKVDQDAFLTSDNTPHANSRPREPRSLRALAEPTRPSERSLWLTEGLLAPQHFPMLVPARSHRCSQINDLSWMRRPPSVFGQLSMLRGPCTNGTKSPPEVPAAKGDDVSRETRPEFGFRAVARLTYSLGSIPRARRLNLEN